MTNLFSVFSPATGFYFPFNWVSLFLLFVLPSAYWFRSSNFFTATSIATNTLRMEFKVVFGLLRVPGSSWFIVSLVLLIVVNCAMGLLPYVFTASAHLSITLSLAFPLWLGHIAKSIYAQSEFIWAHLVPVGTPSFLLAFMVLIELLRSLIRPLTLGVRLAANIIAGHLLFSLISSQALITHRPALLGRLTALLALRLLEIAVALIQGYVFGLLSSLYVQEVLTPKII